MQSAKDGIFKTWIVFFVGTFFHELFHFLVSLVTFGFPYSFSIFPKKIKDSNGSKLYMLGSVKSFNLRWFNVFWISMAPLFLLPFAYYIFKNFFHYFDANIVNFIIWIYIQISMVFSSIPSSVDFGNLKRGSFLLNLFGGFLTLLIGVFMYYTGVFEWVYLIILQIMK